MMAPTASVTCTTEDLLAIDPWTILQGESKCLNLRWLTLNVTSYEGVPGTPLVQKLLENSSIVARDGSSIDATY